MNKEEVDTLESIVRLKGNCLHQPLCKSCPFKKECLPGFINHIMKKSQQERFNLALTALTNISLLADNNH